MFKLCKFTLKTVILITRDKVTKPKLFHYPPKPTHIILKFFISAQFIEKSLQKFKF